MKLEKLLVMFFQMRLSLFVALTLTFTAIASPAATPQKNICTVTLNSSEEVILFKKHFSPIDWNFIELTENATSEQDTQWLQKSCEKQIQCDILLVSGHFGGTFFGRSPFKLSTEELETASCNSRCDGILHRPKEVFLFDCNTLASKDKDRRTPEEYMRVLIEDGFSQAQASQIVSFRYSGFGDSFKTKMSQIFAKTPRIYGFSSIGPSGKTVEPFLSKYLESSSKDYAHFEQYIASQATKKNNKLLEALKKTSIDQASGNLLNMKNVEEKPYCYIKSPKVNNVQKIKYIEELLGSGDGIKMLSHIQSFIHTLKATPALFGPAEKQALENIRQNEKIKKDLANLLNLNGALYIPLKVNVINTLRDLDVLTLEAANAGMNKILQLNKPFNEEKQNYICSSGMKVNVTSEAIPEARYNESAFIIVLTCMAPDDASIADKVVRNLAPAQTDMFLKANSIYAIQRLKSKNENHYLAIIKVLETPNLPLYVNFAVAFTLGQLKPKNPQTRALIAKALAQEQNEVLRYQLNLALAP